MSANLAIEKSTGSARIAVNQKNGLPWHNSGQLMQDLAKTDEALDRAKLDYLVNKSENYIRVGDVFIPTGSFSTYFDNSGETVVLGNKLGDRYVILQNKDAFKFFDNILGEKLAIIDSCGALGKGETVFISAKLPQSSFVKVGSQKDAIDNYVVLTHSHDGTGAIKAFFTPVRIVCENTLNAALGNIKNSISVRHTTNAQERLYTDAMAVWGMVQKNIPVFTQVMEKFAKTRISDPVLKQMLEKVFPGKQDEKGEYSTRISNIRETVLEYYHSHDTQKGLEGTAYGVYNAVTGYLGNVKSYKNDSVRFSNLVDTIGPDFDSKQVAFNELAALAGIDFAAMAN